MYEMTRTVNCSCLSSDGCIRNSAVVDFLQDCSIRHLDTHPVMSPYFEQENCVMFLTSRQIEILRKPHYNEKIRIKTYIYELNRIYGSRNTITYDEQGEIIVRTYAMGAFMDKISQRPKKVPKELIERVRLYPKIDMNYLPRKIFVPKCEPKRFPNVNVLKCFIDMNGHVNNARYFDIADEYLPENAQVSCMRIEYKRPLKRNDVCIPFVYEGDNIITVDLQSEDGISYCIIEYTLV